MAFVTTSRPSRLVIILQMAILLLVLFINESTTSSFEFITQPKRKEIFVGDSVQFNWDYKDDKDEIKLVRFGNSSNSVGTQIENILQRKPGNDFVTYLKSNARGEISAVPGTRASFEIKNVRMNRTGYYFCELMPKKIFDTPIKSIVYLQVVDLQIDTKRSDVVEESWPDQFVSLVCSVRVTENTPVEFTWQQKPSNRTISRGKHVDANKESILKLITSNSDEHFTTYTCIAKTKKTTRTHDIVVKRLYGPGKPENLQSQLTFSNEREDSYYKITWSKPKNNGGAKVTGYIVEYKPKIIPKWTMATRARTEKLEFTKLNIKEGKTYEVRVKARNKVQEGEPSLPILIKLDPSGTSKEASSNNSNKVQIMFWLNLLCLSLMMFF